MGVYNGHLQVVETLLKDLRVDPSADNQYAIRFAAYNGHLQVVETLLKDSRVDPSANNQYAIRWASHNGSARSADLCPLGQMDIYK